MLGKKLFIGGDYALARFQAGDQESSRRFDPAEELRDDRNAIVFDDVLYIARYDPEIYAERFCLGKILLEDLLDFKLHAVVAFDILLLAL